MNVYRDPAEEAVLCRRREYRIPLLKCAECGRFPCASLSERHLATLRASAFTDLLPDGFLSRRVTMFVFRKEDGTLVEAYQGFSPEKPDFGKLADVSEVLCVNKVLVKQMKLVVKDKSERASVRARLGEEDAEPTPKRSRRK